MWQKLPKPFVVLAPMANVTDAVFRSLIAKYGKADATWTEFVSADGLLSSGKKKLLVDLDYSEKERPIVAQLFTGHPEAMKKAAKLVAKMAFDGLDINMGCPDRAVEKQGGGSSLIRHPKLALQIIDAARQGAGKIPVSVKTRLGYNTIDLNWIGLLLEQKLPALTIHLRTRKEMSKVPAHWEIMPEIVKLRDEISPQTLIIGNGDVNSLAEAFAKCKQYGCDGVMIGRGIFGKPWFFANKEQARAGQVLQNISETDLPPEMKIKILLEHVAMFEKSYLPFKGTKGQKGRRKGLKNFDIMKKHFKAYISGWEGAKELRIELMEAKSPKEVTEVLLRYCAKN